MIDTHPLRRLSRLGLLGVLLTGLILLGGCMREQRSLSMQGFNVPQKAALDAEAVVETMRRAGLDDDQVLAHGPALRNYLATQGGARLMSHELTLAMFMVRRDEVHGVAINRSAFHVPLKPEAPEPAGE